MSLTIGSLFSGIGGLELGLERAGLGPVIWQCEIDQFCRQVLAKHWPDVERYPDVEDFGRHKALPSSICDGCNLRPVDVICGGFPCVDISNAGKRAGIRGERSSLWREFSRIVRLVRPRFVVVENVAVLLGRGLGVVLGDLAACGYDAEWDCVPAQAVGAPHRRYRILVVAWRVPDAERDGIRQQPERGQDPAQATDGWHAELEHVRQKLANGDGGRRSQGSQAGQPSGLTTSRPRRQWPPGPDDLRAWGRVQADAQPSLCRLADGSADGLVRSALKDRRQKLGAIGNAVVPQVAEVVGRRLLTIAKREGVAC